MSPARQGKEAGRSGRLVTTSSRAKEYEDDEEACFNRVKELWHDRVSISPKECQHTARTLYYRGSVRVMVMVMGRVGRQVRCTPYHLCLGVWGRAWGGGGGIFKVREMRQQRRAVRQGSSTCLLLFVSTVPCMSWG